MPSNTNTILIVDDDADNLFVLQADLEHMGHKVQTALGGENAIQLATKVQFSLVILDVEMPGMNGYEVFGKLRTNPNYENVPFLFLSANRVHRNDVIEGLKKGAFDYIVKPYDFKELDCRISLLLELHKKSMELLIKNQQLTELAIKDPLTGLYNRRFGMDALKMEVARVNRGNKKLSVLMLDLDDFKGVNDKYGHNVGDDVLKSLSRVLEQSIRDTDICFRMGGDEFMVILPDTDEKSCQIVCERIIQSEKVIFINDGQRLTYHISIGGAIFSNPQADVTHLTEIADLALINAKSAGKNRYKLILDGTKDEIGAKQEVLKVSDVRTSVKSVLTDVLFEVLKEFDINEDIICGHVELMLNLLDRMIEPLKISSYDHKKISNAIKLKRLEHLGVSKEILKTKLPLTDAQKVVLSDALLQNIQKLRNTGFYDDECDVLIQHHEYLNGSGYPSGNQGKTISFLAKVTAILEAFSTLALGGDHTDSHGYTKALQMLKEESDIHFDKEILSKLDLAVQSLIADNCNKKVKVLVIDDMVSITKIICKYIKKFIDIDVIEANSIDAALRKAKDVQFDLILTDVSLPGSDKLSFLEDLSKVTQAKKVVISSGYSAMAWDRKEEFNIVKSFRKPVNLYLLCMEINSILKG